MGLGVTIPVVGSVIPAASHLPSLARMRRDTTKEGNVDVLPSHMSSSGAETVVYAVEPERDDKSKASVEANGSKTRGGGGTALGMPLMAVTNSAIAAARSVLAAMLFRVRDLARVLVLR